MDLLSLAVTISFASALSFTLGMFVLAVSPGPCFFAATARAISGGFMNGAGIMAGAFFGDLIYFLLAIAGMSWIAEQMGDAFVWVKILGGLFLVWMGLKLFLEKPEKTRAKASGGGGFGKAMFEGMLLAMSNPKAIVFYATFLPAFVDLTSLTLGDIGVLIAIIFVVGTGIDLFYVWLASAARRFFQNDNAQRWLNRGGGFVLMGVGAFLASSR